jgi:cytochrome c-type biogenesis protein CcmH/NrfG
MDLADAYRLSREYKKALDAYSKVIKLAPDSSLAANAQKEMEKIK